MKILDAEYQGSQSWQLKGKHGALLEGLVDTIAPRPVFFTMTSNESICVPRDPFVLHRAIAVSLDTLNIVRACWLLET